MSDKCTQQSPRAVFREGYIKAKADAIDRCCIELRGTASDEAIERCVAAINALDVRHAMNMRLSGIVKEAVNKGNTRDE